MPDFDLQIALDRLAESLLPDDEIRQQRANAVVISHDGGVHSRPLVQSLPWYRADISIPGAVVTGSDIRRVAFPQGATIRHIAIHAQTAPTDVFSLRLVADSDVQNFSLQSGQRSVMAGSVMSVNAGSWLVINATAAGGAADVEITIHYTPGGA